MLSAVPSVAHPLRLRLFTDSTYSTIIVLRDSEKEKEEIALSRTSALRSYHPRSESLATASGRSFRLPLNLTTSACCRSLRSIWSTR